MTTQNLIQKPQVFGALGKSAKYVSKKESESESPFENLRYRIQLQSHARALMPESRLRICLRNPAPNAQTVDIKTHNDTPKFHNLMTCGNIWACPICSARIWAGRGAELKTALDNAGALGYHAHMLTFTLSHKYTDTLRALGRDLIKAYRLFWGGRAGQNLKTALGYVGSIRAFEVKYSFTSGFHPHYHVILITENPLPDTIITKKATKKAPAESAPLEKYMRLRWIASLNKAGRVGDYDHALDIKDSTAYMGQYITKQSTLNKELTSRETKKRGVSYTPLELLQLSLDGDSGAGRAWVDFAHGIKGFKGLQYSDQLKIILGVDKTPAESDIQDASGAVYARIPLYIWQSIRKHNKDLRAQILWIAKNESVYNLAVFLSNTLNIPFDETARIYPPLANSETKAGGRAWSLYAPAPRAPLDAIFTPAPRPPDKMRDCDILF